MDVSGATQTQQQTQTQSGTDQTGLNENFDQFLRLLTTQLQNQDPLEPMDTKDFTNQLVQFSSVEQQIKTNSNLESLLSLQTLNMTALGVSFIGKEVQVQGTDFASDGASSSEISYVLPDTAAKGTISILDKDGNVVYTQPSETEAGRHDFVWDGKDTEGNPVPAGTYTLKIGALTDTNAALNVTTFVPGHVDGLESGDDGNLLLLINGGKFPITDVRRISMGT
jgi:flagellar basal-body rod modification protein FlgD